MHSKRTLLLVLIGILTTGIAIYLNQYRWTQQRIERPRTLERKQVAIPMPILEELDKRFETIAPNMNEAQVFSALGLKEYYYELKRTSWEYGDGAGGDWEYFIDNQNGFSLSMRSFTGQGTVMCWLTTPDFPDGREAKTGALSPAEKRQLLAEAGFQNTNW